MKNILIFAAYLVCLLLPLLLLIRVCRAAAWWDPKDKCTAFVEIRSPFLSRLLIGRYLGVSGRMWGSVPVSGVFPTHYYVNPYPNRLSRLGLICDVAGMCAAVCWIGTVTVYFWAEQYHGAFIGAALLILIAVLCAVAIAGSVNGSRRELPALITKAQRRAAQKQHT